MNLTKLFRRLFQLPAPAPKCAHGLRMDQPCAYCVAILRTHYRQKLNPRKG